MLGESKVPAIMLQTLRRAKVEADALRMAEAERRLSILDDDWKDIIYAALCQRWKNPRTQEALIPFITSEHNVLKRIAREKSTVYKWGATRELKDKAQNEIYRKLCEECRIDERLERADLLVEVQRDLLVIPRIINREMNLGLARPDVTTVIQDDRDPTKAVAFWWEQALPNTVTSTRIARSYADAETWRHYDQNDRLIEEAPHGWGRLPAAVVHAQEREEFFWGDKEWTDVVDAAINVACDMVRLDWVLHNQSELRVTYQGKASDLAKPMEGGPDVLWAAPGTFGTLDLQADPEKLMAVIRARLGWIAQQHGMAADVYDLSASAESGFQIRLKRLPLLEQRARKIKTWRRVEKELLTLMALASREHPLLRLDPMRCEFDRLDFHEEPMLEDPSMQNRIWDERIKLGVTSRARVIAELNPDLTLEQAKDELRAITSENEEWILMQKRLGAPKDPLADPGKTQEENGAMGPASKDEDDAEEPVE